MVTAICGGTALLFLMLVVTGKEIASLLSLEAYTEDYAHDLRREDAGG